MKESKGLLAAVALGLSIAIIGVFIISVFNYIAFLKEQNYSLLDNINFSIGQLKKSVTALESDRSRREIIALKNENMALRQELERLRGKIERSNKKQRRAMAPSPAPAKKEGCALKSKDDSFGNRGFLLKEGKPN